MRAIKEIGMRAGFLIALGTPPYLVYDLHQIVGGEATLLHGLALVVGGCLLAASLTYISRMRGMQYVRLRSLWERPLALILLVLTSPFLALTAVLIKLDSPGPIFYRQERVGRNKRRGDRRGLSSADLPHLADRRHRDLGGRPFTIYKLRSMRVNAEAETGAAWSTGDCDPRVTKVGYYIRKIHIDELPQIYNVLKGEMSLIGPRPERPAFVEQLSAAIDGYRQRLTVPPGITGLAQVRQAPDETIEDVRNKLRYDAEYIANASLLFDARILFDTAILIFGLVWDGLKRRRAEKVAPKTLRTVLSESSPWERG
jgi:lipopolysaccharide/colanic/teichoic acid biosynthesis glycosyltransferase